MKFWFQAKGSCQRGTLLFSLLIKMKLLLRILSIFSILVFSGCVTTGVSYSKKNPSEFSASGWNGGSLGTRGEKIGEGLYFITVKGAGACSPEQVMEEAIRVAEELADGQKYRTDFETKPYRYNSSGGGYFFTHDAFLVEGTVRVLSHGVVVSGPMGNTILGEDTQKSLDLLKLIFEEGKITEAQYEMKREQLLAVE